MSRSGKTVILLGPPGCGKDTVAQRLEQSCGCSVLSGSGVLGVVEQDPAQIENARLIRDCKTKGKLVPDHIMNSLIVIAGRTRKVDVPLILNGIPRTQNQVNPVLRLVAHRGGSFAVALFEGMSSEEAIARARKGVRDGTRQQRSDDDPRVINERYEIYQSNLSGILRNFPQEAVFPVDSLAPKEEVFRRITTILAVGCNSFADDIQPLAFGTAEQPVLGTGC